MSHQYQPTSYYSWPDREHGIFLNNGDYEYVPYDYYAGDEIHNQNTIFRDSQYVTYDNTHVRFINLSDIHVYDTSGIKIFDSGTLTLYTSASPSARKFVVDEYGRVGVGMDHLGPHSNVGESPSFDLDVKGQVGIEDYIYHNDDVDTYMLFGSDLSAHNVNVDGSINTIYPDDQDEINFRIGGIDMLQMQSRDVDHVESGVVPVHAQDHVTFNKYQTDVDFVVRSETNTGAFVVSGDGVEVVVNEDGNADTDFRVESDHEDHMLFVDTSVNRISIGDSEDTPQATLEVTNDPDSGAFDVPLVQLNNEDTDKQLLDINAKNIDADVISVSADALVSADVVSVTADSLTTGDVFNATADSLTTGSLIHMTHTGSDKSGVSLVHFESTGDRGDDSNQTVLLDLNFDTTDGTGARALRVDTEQTTGKAFELDASEITTGQGQLINVAKMTTGEGLKIYAGARTTGTGLNVRDVHTSDDPGALVLIEQAGDRTGTAASIGMDIDFNTTANPAARALRIDSEQTTGHVVEVDASEVTTGRALDISTCDSLTTGKIANFRSDSSSSAGRDLVTILNNNESATGARLLWVRNDAIANQIETVRFESTAADKNPLLELRNSNSALDTPPLLNFYAHKASDPNGLLGGTPGVTDLGTITFEGISAGTDLPTVIYAALSARTTDTHEVAQSAGQLNFMVQATDSPAQLRNMLSIGGQTNSASDVVTQAEVVINEDQIDLDFRVETDITNNAFIVYGDGSEVVVNENGADTDFRVEANGLDPTQFTKDDGSHDDTFETHYSAKKTHALYVNAANGRVGIGHDTPSTTLHVAGSAHIEGDLWVKGVTNQLDTMVHVTSAMDIHNIGTGPTLTVTQSGAQPVATFWDMDHTDTLQPALYLADKTMAGFGTVPTAPMHLSDTVQNHHTSDPLATLRIDHNYDHGGIAIDSTRGDKQSHLRFLDAGSPKWQIRHKLHHADCQIDNFALYSWPYGGDLMNWTHNGEVGIGLSKTCPDYVLDVQATTKAGAVKPARIADWVSKVQEYHDTALYNSQHSWLLLSKIGTASYIDGTIIGHRTGGWSRTLNTRIHVTDSNFTTDTVGPGDMTRCDMFQLETTGRDEVFEGFHQVTYEGVKYLALKVDQGSDIHAMHWNFQGSTNCENDPNFFRLKVGNDPDLAYVSEIKKHRKLDYNLHALYNTSNNSTRYGISTSEPDSPLTIKSDSSTQRLLHLENGGHDQGQYIHIDGQPSDVSEGSLYLGCSQPLISVPSPASGSFATTRDTALHHKYAAIRGNHGIDFATNGSIPRMTISEAGKVGIGKHDPQWGLDISSSGASVQFQLGRHTNNSGSAWMGADSRGFHLGWGEYGADNAGGSTTQPNGMLIDKHGNMGLKSNVDHMRHGSGTTHPTGYDQPAPNLEIQSTESTTALLRVGHSNNGSQGTGAIEVTQDAFHGGGISYNGDKSPTFIANEVTDAITFYRSGSETGGLDDDGNPDSSIQFVHRQAVFYYMYNSNDVTFLGNINLKNDAPCLKLTDTTGAHATWHTSTVCSDSSNGALILTADQTNKKADTFISFRIDGEAVDNEKMRIEDTGDVGIGTTNPHVKLEVHGDPIADESPVSIIQRLVGEDKKCIFEVLKHSDTGLTEFRNNKYSDGVNGNYAFSSGDVGIGQLSPGSELHIGDSDKTTATSIQLENKRSKFKIESGFRDALGSTKYEQLIIHNNRTDADGDFLPGRPANGRIMTIDYNGHINIGTGVTPSCTLDIQATDAIQIPAGTSDQRPGGSGNDGETGMIRYNSTLSTFEGYGENAWGSLGGVVDTDKDTYIDPESGNDNDQLEFFTAGVKRMTLDASGFVVGTLGTLDTSLAGTTFAMAVGGNVRADGDVIAFATSDKRYKDNLTLIDNPIDKINKIGGYTFDWNKDSEYTGSDVGVVAQEVEQVLPEVVNTRDNGDKAVNYEKMIPLLIECIKDQQKQIDELKYMLENK